MITISAFRWIPDFAKGLVRDLRVRWALEEAGLDYRTRLLEQGDQDQPDYRALQPFGQVPILEEDGLIFFEPGAIVLYIGERSEALLPKDPGARARATQMAGRGTQFHRALRHERRFDRFLLCERGMGKVAPPRRRRVRAEAPLRPLYIARRQALSRRPPLHGRRPHDDNRAPDPQAHRHCDK